MNQQKNNPKRKETINEMIEREKKKRESFENLLGTRTVGKMTEDELLEQIKSHFQKIDLSKLGEFMKTNSIGQIEEIMTNQLVVWPEYEVVVEWLTHQDGIADIEKWRQFEEHGDFEKKRYPKASEFKQSLIYWLDNVYQTTKINDTTEER
jgi:hypothetical protein